MVESTTALKSSIGYDCNNHYPLENIPFGAFHNPKLNKDHCCTRIGDKVIDLAYEMGAIEGLEKEEVKEYIRYLADRRLIQLGLKPNFKVKHNPLEWLDWIINGDSFKNFFDNMPYFFSILSLVLLSGVSIPNSLTLLLYIMSKPKSNNTSIVSPSTTFTTLLTR